MNALKLTLAALLLVVNVGCDPLLSVNPWFGEHAAVEESAFEGNWATADGKKVMHVERVADSVYTLTFTSEGRSSRYRVRILNAGRYYLMDFQVEDDAIEQLFKDEFYLPTRFFHFLAVMELRRDTLKLAYFTGPKSAIRSGEISIAHVRDDEDDFLLLSDSTDKLHELAEKYADKMDDDELFESVGVFERQSDETAFFLTGEQYAQEGKLSQADAAYRRALELKPDFALALKGLGEIAVRQGFYEQGREFLEQAVALAPDSPEMRLSLAFTLAALGRYDEARRECEIALRLRPDDAAVLHALGSIRFLEKRYAEAIRYFERYESVEEHPHQKSLLVHALALMQERRSPEALRLLEARGPGELRDYFLGRTREDVLLSVLRSDEQSCSVHFYVGYRHLLAGDREVARAHFRKAAASRAYSDFEYIAAAALLRDLEIN